MKQHDSVTHCNRMVYLTMSSAAQMAEAYSMQPDYHYRYYKRE